MEDSKKGKYKPPGTATFTSALWLALCFGFFSKKFMMRQLKIHKYSRKYKLYITH